MKCTINDIANVISESISNPAESGYDIFVGLEHYDSGEVKITRYGSTDSLVTAVKVFKKGDILLARRNVYLKRAGLVDFDGVTSGDSIVLRVKPDLSKLGTSSSSVQKYLPFVLNTEEFWNYAEKYSDGTMSKRLSPKTLLQYEFEIPDDVDNRNDLLWSAFETKESYRTMIKAIDEMVKSQFIEMFSGREYPQLPIRDFADITTGSTPSKSHPEYWGGSNPWVSAEDMKDKYVYDTVEKVTDKGYATCKHIPVNTLMYVCRGSIGVMAINKVECATNQSICTATCKADKCEVEFLYHSLLYKKDEIKQIGIGTNFKSLNQTTFSNLRIFLPPIEEQRRFVSITTQADKSKFELKQAIEKIDKVMRSLMQ